ncbi:hypothetical protein T06_13896 [Trichinella sp. T6]|nr:hypothetical protein T06_13896 [Trichinella sp. T6]
MTAEAVVHRWAMSMAFLHNNAILPFTFVCVSYFFTRQLVGAYRDVDTESTKIDSDKESDVTLVSDFKAKHGSDELLEVGSDGDVFLYIYDESDDADSNSKEAAIYSELENERMHILKKREFTFSEVYAALGTIIRAGADKDNLPAVEDLYLLNNIRPFYSCAMSNVFMDRYFTSYSIVQHLLELGLTAVGTVSANRRDVPLCLRNTRGHDVYSTLAVYEHSKNYVPRKNKNVLLMSSCHTKLKIDTSEMTEDQTS